jgi:hypothetical protein
MTVYVDAPHTFIFGEPTFRLRLDRMIDPTNPRCIAYGLQNSSTAESDTAGKDDMTTRRLVAFTRHLGYGRFILFNPHTYRASTPTRLYHWLETESSLAERDAYKASALDTARAICREADTVVVASGECLFHDRWVQSFWRTIGAEFPLFCLGLTLAGAPIHPAARGKSRLPDAVTLKPWKPQ